MIKVSLCLPSDALSQHLPSYLGFSYLGRWVSLHVCSSTAYIVLNVIMVKSQIMLPFLLFSMRRADSLEKTLMLGKAEVKRRRERAEDEMVR